jgi:hypothetical protein
MVLEELQTLLLSSELPLGGINGQKTNMMHWQARLSEDT